MDFLRRGLSKLLVLPLFAVFALFLLASYLWNVRELERSTTVLAKDRAKAFFSLIERQRHWNAYHGGIYVPVTDKTPPNPYLDDPMRDLVTVGGIRLTKVNPAYMTRQISELMEGDEILSFRLTSLNPIRPENRPDLWEEAALEDFLKSGKERFELINGGTYRYMAPLPADPACIDCHGKQGYRVGDIRGGLSISFKAEPYLKALDDEKEKILFIHIGALAAGGMVLLGFYGFSRRAERALKGSEERYRMIFDSGNDAVFIHGIDDEGRPSRFTEVNRVACERLGYGKEELLGLTPKDIDDPEYPPLSPDVLKEFNLQGSVLFETVHVAKDGKKIPVEINAHVFEMNGERFVLSIARDIAERKKYEDNLMQLSITDGLTGIANRRHFNDVYDREWRRAVRDSEVISVIIVDIDFFKLYNDTYGHQAGDDCLRAVALCMKKALRRPADLVARFGGEEFIALLPGTESGGAMAIADEIRTCIEVLNISHEKSSVCDRLTVSAGVASVKASREFSPTSFISDADRAMYRAKDKGRNRVEGGPI